MINVKLDGNPFSADVSRLHSMPELVELIKSTIDPDSIITALSLEGAPLTDADWRIPLAAQSGKLLEVTTGDKGSYLAERLALADSYLTQISGALLQAAEGYNAGELEQANRTFAATVGDLQAFLSWYASLITLDDTTSGTRSAQYSEQLKEIKTACDVLAQQQMFNSWFLMAETIKSKLIPQLERLAAFCKSMIQ